MEVALLENNQKRPLVLAKSNCNKSRTRTKSLTFVQLLVSRFPFDERIYY